MRKVTDKDVQAILESSPFIRTALGDFASKHPDFVRMLHANEQHIQSLERIIERQEKRIEKLARENEKLKAASPKR